jgi:hypothetical protein
VTWPGSLASYVKARRRTHARPRVHSLTAPRCTLHRLQVSRASDCSGRWGQIANPRDADRRRRHLCDGVACRRAPWVQRRCLSMCIFRGSTVIYIYICPSHPLLPDSPRGATAGLAYTHRPEQGGLFPPFYSRFHFTERVSQFFWHFNPALDDERLRERGGGGRGRCRGGCQAPQQPPRRWPLLLPPRWLGTGSASHPSSQPL